jgi:hypothetical protein
MIPDRTRSDYKHYNYICDVFFFRITNPYKAFVSKILGKILGKKSDRDIAEVAPLVEAVKKEYERIKLLTNDDCAPNQNG